MVSDMVPYMINEDAVKDAPGQFSRAYDILAYAFTNAGGDGPLAMNDVLHALALMIYIDQDKEATQIAPVMHELARRYAALVRTDNLPFKPSYFEAVH